MPVEVEQFVEFSGRHNVPLHFGVDDLDIRMPDETGAIPISLFVDSVPVRDANLAVWLRATSP